MSDTPPPGPHPEIAWTYEEPTSPAVVRLGKIWGKQVVREDGVTEYHNAILVEPHHCNTWEMTHGSFIGALGEIAAPGGYVAGGPPVVIIDLNMHFIGTAKAGQWIEMVGTINRKTRSLVFAEGRGMADGQLVFTATAIHKIVGG
jgi:acyl-coenzyme A thioesterase PaaI-like protein